MSSQTIPSPGEPEPDSNFAPRLERLPREVEWFTMHEAARIKGVSYTTVSRAVRAGKLPARRAGRMRLISEFDLISWEPHRARAPHRYRHRQPDPESAHGMIDLAHGEGLELARRISSHYEAILRSAHRDSFNRFVTTIVERFALAMEFDRVALWLVNPERSHVELIARFGSWFAPESEPTQTIRAPFDPRLIYIVSTDVYEGINCWLIEPRPVRFREAFSATLVADDQVLGYLIGDHNGEAFDLTNEQLSLGNTLATLIGVAIELRRGREPVESTVSLLGIDHAAR